MQKITIDELSTEELEALESYWQDEVVLWRARNNANMTTRPRPLRQLSRSVDRLSQIEDALESCRRDDADSTHDAAMELKEGD